MIGVGKTRTNVRPAFCPPLETGEIKWKVATPWNSLGTIGEWAAGISRWCQQARESYDDDDDKFTPDATWKAG
jgi:hypothetical protein